MRLLQLLATAACLLALSCGHRAANPLPDPYPPPTASPYTAELNQAARAVVAGMDDDTLAGQVIMTGVGGRGRLDDANSRYLEELKPGAILLFRFNVPAKPLELRPFADQVASAAGGLRAFVAIDHEGGDVFRFGAGVTRLPSAAVLGSGGPDAAEAAGRAAGTELAALGVTLNLAPVAEALDDHNRAFLGTRTFSTGPLESGSLAWAFLRACQDAGTAGALKHFPGNAGADPHHGLPVISATGAELKARYAVPFMAALRARPAAVVLSHAVVAGLDPETPATLSAPVILALKRVLGFDGIVLTDDLVMGALGGEGSVGATAVRALNAGADMLMVSGGRPALASRDAILGALADGTLSRARLEDAAFRVVREKLRFGSDSPIGTLDGASFQAMVARNRAALDAALQPESAAQ
ncbi:MAG: glycoside hydrolase family 3 protein [Spirochaetales bacterium]|nr:glycoside hydrolase family 3 protein [Spirochaetales bacterium]MBP7263199.1 glycoside hydrolase family 3 protein [Spirochaetia bacterium]